MALLLESLDRHHLDVARDVSSAAAVDESTAGCPACCTDVLRGSWWPLLRALAGSSTALAAGRVGSIVIGQLLQHHGLDSPNSYRLGGRLGRLQPHHLGCR
jgi:hypothetical protein